MERGSPHSLPLMESGKVRLFTPSSWCPSLGLWPIINLRLDATKCGKCPKICLSTDGNKVADYSTCLKMYVECKFVYKEFSPLK